MNAKTPINLNDSWHYLFADEANIDLRTIQRESLIWVPLTALSDWLITSSVENGTDWFWRTININRAITQDQTRFVLKIHKVPDDVLVYVNGKPIGKVQGLHAFKADITPHIKSGNNDIIFKLTSSRFSNGGGRFGDISLNLIHSSAVARLH